MSFAIDFPVEYTNRLGDSIESGYPVRITSSTPSMPELNVNFILTSLPVVAPSVDGDRIIFGWFAGDSGQYLEVSEPSASHTVFRSDLIKVSNNLTSTVFFSPAICQDIEQGKLSYTLKDVGNGKQFVVPFRGDTVISFQQSISAEMYTTNVGGFEVTVAGVGV